MKRLILIGGTMGVGKSATCHVLKKKFDKSVFLDGDWCWDMHPFVVSENTKNMVLDNITYMLNRFIHTDEIENIVFCWVMHKQDIIDEIISRIDKQDVEIYCLSLICSKEVLIQHLLCDIHQGKRDKDIIERSVERLDMYKKLKTYQIDVSHYSLEETAESIYKYVMSKGEELL